MHARPDRAGARAASRRDRRVAVVALLLVSVAGCSGDASNPPAPSSSSSAAAPQVHTRVTRVAGRLPAARRQAVERRIGTLLQRYVEAAFVQDRSGRSAFPGFTGGARRLAIGDERVLTRGSQPTEAARASAFVSVFAAGSRAQGATVRLHLKLAAPGNARPVPLTGRLLVTPTRSGWRIFGYDVARGGRDPGAGGRR